MKRAYRPDQNLGLISKKIEHFIASYCSKSHARGLVMGLSGGLDSSVVLRLCVNAIGPEKMLGLIMPSSSTPKEDIQDAVELAKAFGVRYQVIDLDPIVDRYSQVLPKDKRARGNLTARIRMNILYYHAAVNGYLVAGTSDRTERQIGFYCYDEKTRALTKDGFKTYAELKIGDIVFSLDPNTKKVREMPVSRIHIFDYSGKMAYLKSRAFDLMVTPNHKMLVHGSAHLTSPISFQTIERCLTRNVIAFPISIGWDGSRTKHQQILPIDFHQNHRMKHADIEINDLLYMLGLFIEDGSCTKSRVTTLVKSEMTEKERIESANQDASGRFTALLTTEEPHEKIYPTYETYFALPLETKAGPRAALCKILKKYDINFSSSKYLIRIASREIYDLFVQCGLGARNKQIPQWILNYPSENLIWLYKGMMESDGDHKSDDPGNRSYYTTSKDLVSGFIELAIKIGKLGSWRSHKARTIFMDDDRKPYFISSGTSFSISTTLKIRSRIYDNKNTKWVDYHGKVWCPEIPETRNLLVERNGKLLFCGNTKFGDGAADILPIADLYKTQVRKLARFLQIPSAIIEKKSSPRLWDDHLAEDELGMTYETIDPILQLLDKKKKPQEIAKKLKIPLDDVHKVNEMVEKSEHKRNQPPFVELTK